MAAISTAPAARRRRTMTRAAVSTLLIALPGIVLFAAFSWWPIVQGLLIAFQKTNLITSSWVGFANFSGVLADPLLGTALRNTAYYTLLAVVFGFPVPVICAVVIGEMRRAKRVSSVLAFLPVIIPPVVTILLWQVFYDPRPKGLFNSVLRAIGIDAQPWLQSTTEAMPSIVLVTTWGGFGMSTIIYLASLATIDQQLYEAAELDGASLLRRVWHITLPQLRTTMLVLLLLQLIGNFQIFTEPFLLTGGGPNNATLTLLILIFRYAFIYGDFGRATALSLMLALGLGVVSVIYLFVTRKWSRS